MHLEDTMICEKFGAVAVNKGFECLKHNGKAYAGNIVRVAAYPKGTLVTIQWYDPKDDDTPNYRSVYLEECAEWLTYTYRN